MKHKKLIAAFLAAVMAVTCLPQAAIAEPLAQETPTEGVPQEAGTLSTGDRFTDGDFEYEVIDSYSVAVVDYYGSDTKITIPSEVLLDGLYRHDVTEIGSYAFEEQRSLTEVTLPNTVTAIGNSAFAYCVSLKTINIPYSVTEIGAGAFRSCGLEKITVPFSVDTIGASAFSYCSSLTEVTIEGYLDKLESGMFSDCESLKTVTLEYAKEIGGSAFSFCTSLEEIELPVNLEIIGSYAFWQCKALKEITIPWDVTTIGDHAFLGCEKLTAIHAEYNNNFYDIDGVLFTESTDNGVTLLQYPEGKTDMSYSVPDGVTTIGEWAFEGCSSLTEINLPDSVTEIKRQAMRSCDSLEKVTLSKSLTTIEYAAFANCLSLPEIDIPENVQTIEDCAFDGCKALTKAVIRSSVANISYNVFTKGTIAYGPSADLTIYGYTNSSAETYAKEKEMDFVSLGLFLDSDSDVSVTADSGILPDDTKLSVKQTDTTDTSAYYSITLTQNGQEIQPKGNVTVRIRIPFKYSGEPIYVYYEDDNGRLTDMHAVVSGDYIVFTTDHFSKYIATKDKLATVIPGDIDGDGVVNDIDVVSLARYLAGWGTKIEASAADVNGDKEINDLDTVALARQLAGWEL